MVRRCLVRSAGWEAVGCVFLASGPQPGTLWIRETVHVRALLVALRRRQRERKREVEREVERERVCVCVFFVCVCVCVFVVNFSSSICCWAGTFLFGETTQRQQ